METDQFIRLNILATGNILLDGKLEVTEIKTGVLTIKVVDDIAATIGTATITPIEIDEYDDEIDDVTDIVISDGVGVEVNTVAVSSDSNIFVTIRNKLSNNLTLMVTKIKDGKSFKVETVTPVEEKIEFNWWIVDVVK